VQRNRRAALAFAAALVAVTLGRASVAAAQTPPAAQPQPAQPPAQPGEKWPQNPATAADPPLLPPPSSAPGAPISTSGTDVVPPSHTSQPAPIVLGDKDAHHLSDEARRKMGELEARVALDEARLKTLENDLGPLRNLRIEGYVQLQYRFESVNAAGSQNRINGSLPPGISSNDVIAKPDGTTTNTNMFRLRRTRLRTIYETDVVRVFLQADLLPTGGPVSTEGTIARNAEATGIAHWTKDVKTEFTGGLFQIPFRDELTESSMYRPFIERTWAAQNLFPTERDLGLHAKTFVSDRFTFDFGVLNGQRLGERTFVLQPDLNSAKDFFANAAVKLGPVDLSLAGYLGRGQVVDRQLLRVKNFGRLGMNVGVGVAHKLVPKLGETKLMAELLFGSNMDTGVNYPFALPAIPAQFGDSVKDLDQRAFYVRVEQDLTKWGMTGFRYDTYTTDASISNNGRDTYTFMLGARFSKYLRLVNELSYAIDNIHAPNTDAPSRHIAAYTAWMQGSFY
jgi:hypothetical protein